jgi:leucyl aminopeptidase (aminopeptidase T)
MGGTVRVQMHLDGIIKKPTVWLDGKMWMKSGVLM